MSRRVEVAELVLLAAALAVGLLLVAAILLQYCIRHRRLGRGRRTTNDKQPAPPELPVSTTPTPTPTASPSPAPAEQQTCGLIVMLCTGRRRARVEPASAASSAAMVPIQIEEELEDVVVARWFGPAASRALYTIDEERDEECSTTSTEDAAGGDRDEDGPEPETPFYTPPATPPRASGPPPAGMLAHH